MTDGIVFKSAFGRIGYISLALVAAACIPLFLVASLRYASLVSLIVISAFIILLPKAVSYTFDDEKLTVHVPFGLQEPPAYYRNIWKIVDTDMAMLSNHHGMSEKAIMIWYDRGKGHYICISPDDKERALGILRERCPNAEFLVERRKQRE